MTPGKGLNEMEISNLLYKEFKVMVIKIHTEIGKSTQKLKENFKREIGSLKEPLGAEEYNNCNKIYNRRNEE